MNNIKKIMLSLIVAMLLLLQCPFLITVAVIVTLITAGLIKLTKKNGDTS